MNVWIIIYRKKGSQVKDAFVPHELESKIVFKPLVPSDLNLEDHEIVDIIRRTYDFDLFEFQQ